MESFYDWGSINLNNKEKLIQDNYSKVNQISARCMRVIVAILALAFVYCYFGTDMDESVLIVFFASAIFIALIPTLIINILKFDHAPVTKHIVIICVCLIATLMLTLLSTYAYPIMLFPDPSGIALLQSDVGAVCVASDVVRHCWFELFCIPVFRCIYRISM